MYTLVCFELGASVIFSALFFYRTTFGYARILRLYFWPVQPGVVKLASWYCDAHDPRTTFLKNAVQERNPYASCMNAFSEGRLIVDEICKTERSIGYEPGSAA